MQVGRFNSGDKIWVWQLYYGGAHGEGVVLKMGETRESQGKYLIDIGHSNIYIEPERVLTESEYKEKINNESKKFIS